MPTFRVTCGTADGHLVQIVVEAPDGVAARAMTKEMLTDTWQIGLVQLDPDDPKFVQMQDHITRQFTGTNVFLNHHSKLLKEIHNKTFTHWTLFFTIITSLLVFFPIAFVLYTILARIFAPFLRAL